MSDPLHAFPDRPIHARPPAARRETFWAYLGALMFAAILAASCIWVAPALVTDWQIRDTAVPINGGRLVKGSCSGKAFIDICDLTLTAPGPAGTVHRDLHYLFLSFEGRFTATVVGDPARPDWITTDLGLDYFWNRVGTLLATWALMAAFLVGFVISRVGKGRRNSALRQPMLPTALELVDTKADRNGAHWTVRTDSGLTVSWTLPKKAKPFVLGPENRILGLAASDGSVVMPVDAELRWTDLAEPERQAVLAAQAG